MSKKSASKSRWNKPLSDVKRQKGWKDTQTTKKTKKQTKLAVIVLALIIIVISSSQIIKFVNNLLKPFNEDVATKRSYTWDGKSNINVVVKGSSVGVFSYNPIDQKISLVNIPDETYINVPGGFGNWQVRSIFKFGESLEKPMGSKILKDSMTDFLGVPIDGYLTINEKEALTPGMVVEKIRKGPIPFLSSIRSIKTDLGLIELIKLSYGMSGVRFDNVSDINLIKLYVLEKQNLPDGSEVLVPDFVRIDNVLQNFNETNLVTERISVAIFNATSVPGLAQKAARMINNIGGNVIVSTNAEVKRENTAIILSDNTDQVKDTDTYKKITNIFNSDCQKNPKCDILANDPQIKLSRAKINVILGNDFANN